MKIKLCTSIFCFFLIITLFYSVCAAEKEIKVFKDGTEILFDVKPQTINYRTMVPVRKIFETFGMTVRYDEKTEVISAKGNGNELFLQIGSTKMIVNGKEVLLDSPAVEIDGRTLVPVRAIAESLGVKVDWDEEKHYVMITELPQISFVNLGTLKNPFDVGHNVFLKVEDKNAVKFNELSLLSREDSANFVKELNYESEMIDENKEWHVLKFNVDYPKVKTMPISKAIGNLVTKDDVAINVYEKILCGEERKILKNQFNLEEGKDYYYILLTDKGIENIYLKYNYKGPKYKDAFFVAPMNQELEYSTAKNEQISYVENGGNTWCVYNTDELYYVNISCENRYRGTKVRQQALNLGYRLPELGVDVRQYEYRLYEIELRYMAGTKESIKVSDILSPQTIITGVQNTIFNDNNEEQVVKIGETIKVVYVVLVDKEVKELFVTLPSSLNGSVCNVSLGVDYKKKEDGNSVVYITPYGYRYHYSKDCAGPNAQAVSVTRAESEGKSACATCAN